MARAERWLTALLLMSSAMSQGAVYTIDQVPRAEEKIAPQHFNFYVPDHPKQIRAIVIIQHGNANVPNLAEGWAHGFGAAAWDVQWRAFADKWDAAVVFPCLEGSSCHYWYDPDHGGWRVLTEALTTLGIQSGHPETARAPLCLYGFSCGADWGAMMLKEHAERIVAVVARSGGSDPGKGADGVPVLLVQGGPKDRYENEKWFVQARARGALAAFVQDTNQGHTPADLNVLALPFLDACMTLRLPTAAGGELKSIESSSGWLGDQKTYAIAGEPAYAGDKTVASWLPTETLARKWSEFADGTGHHGTGWATDTTPPEQRPNEVAAVINGGDVTLKWHAAADLESGIRHFAIYRDGVKIATLGGKASTGHGGHAFFQWGWDTKWPTRYPELPPVQWPFPASFTEQGVPAGTHVYEIATVNGENLEGPKSLATEVIIGASGAALAPIIVSQPQDVHLVEPLRASFTFSVSGTGPMTYQWRKNGVVLAGASDATYTTPVTAITDHQEVFSVVVTGPGGTATSRDAKLFVTAGHSMCPVLNIMRDGNPILPGTADAIESHVSGQAVNVTYTLSNTGMAPFDDQISEKLGDFNNCVASVSTAPVLPLKVGDSVRLVTTVIPMHAGNWSFSVLLDSAQIPRAKWTVSNRAPESAK